MMEFELPVANASTLVAYCRLPRSVIAKLQGCSFAVVTINPKNSPSMRWLPPYVVAWNGGISSTDALEIPDGSLNCQSTSGMICDVTIVTRVRDVVDVTIHPKTEYDWDIVATQAQYVENNMLKTHSIVFVGQNLCVRINASLSASFVVQSINFQGGNGQASKNDSQLKFGRITNDTSLLVAPYVKAMATAGDNERSNSEGPLMSMLDADVEPTSHEQVLFVVPEHCRSINSSYMLPLQSIYNGLPPEVSSCAYQPMLESTDYEVQCKLDDLYLNTFLDLSSSNNNFSSSESSHTSNITPENASVYCGDGCEENNSRADRLIDHLAAFVHPLYFLRCYEKTLGKTLTEEEWNQAKNILASQAIIACVETVRRKSTTLSGSATSVNTVTPHALVRLEMSENIRPGACLLPLNLRKGMCLDDYDEVRMYLVTRRLGAAVLPETIVLNPLQWNVSAETSVLSIQSAPPSTVLRLGESSLSNGDEVDSNVKMAFERFVQQNSWPKRPFILHDKQVVTLQIVDHCTTGSLKSATCTNTDYVVNISTGAKKKPALPAHVLLHSTSASSPSSGNRHTQPRGTLDACLEVLSIERSSSGVPATESAAGEAEGAGAVSVATTSDSTFLQADTCPGLLVPPSERSTLVPRAIIQQLVLLRSAFQRVLQDVFTTLLPAAVLSCLKIHGAPQVASLVTGAKGTGKTTFLQTMSRLLHHNIVTHSHVLILDCATLKALPLEQVLLRLSEAFNSCRGYPTGLICLDNLDVLCPAGKESGAGTLRDERSSVISLHLELLLKDVHNRLNRKSNDRANPVATPDVAVPYVRERLLHDRLQSAIYVLATADGTSNIWPSLLSDFAFRRVIPLDTLSESAKLQVLAGALGDLGMTLQVPSSSHQEDLLVGALQGYRLADVHNLAKRVCFSVLQRGHRRALQEGVPTAVGMVATTEDLLTAAESYQPISSSSQASSAKRGGVAAAAVSGVSWRDVSAYDTVKCSILDTIKTPLIYAKLFRNCPIKLPRSVLLYGPPGCGKTLLAQAAGSEFGRGFIAVRGPELLDKYIGASEKAVRDLFQQARDRNRACLIFFDEFESLAPRRGKDNTGVTDRIVNQLLTFIDGVESTMSGTGGGGGGGGGGGDDDSEDGDDREGMSGDSGGGAGQIFIMAATSRPDLIDPALLRPGRIEKHIYVGLPDQSERQEILRAALSRLSVNLDSVHSAVEAIVSDKKAPQLSAADWKAVVNTAFLAATHDFIDASKSHTISKKVDKVSITEKHLRAAYAETKPSVSVADLQYYDSIYARFGHKATAEGVASKKSATIDDAALRQSYH